MSSAVAVHSAPLNSGTARSGITAPLGFRAAGIHCGVRRSRPDLAMIVSDKPAVASAVYTRNLVKAAPLLVTEEHLARSAEVKAVVVNSGVANACTGQRGIDDARMTARRAAALLGSDPETVLVASTGVIGQPLPLDRVLQGLPALVSQLHEAGGPAAAEAILTTDTFTKTTQRKVELAGGTITLGGMAKGSGMIHPDMATTLGFVTTDADIPRATLDHCLRTATARTFNRITVDGDTSTNDMVILLANGASGVHLGPTDRDTFLQALTELMTELARMVASDGEGASRLISVEVTGADSEDNAVAAARTVAASALVRTAVHGADANWGRIVAAVGRAGVPCSPESLTVSLNGLVVLSPGFESQFDEAEASRRLASDEVVIRIDMGLGSCQATTWTCDLTAEYVRINASYRS